MEFKAKEIAGVLQGVVEGDPEVAVHSVSKIEEGVPGTLAFLANPKYEPCIYTTKASVVLVDETFQPAHPLACTLIRVPSAYDAFAALLRMYEEMRPRQVGIEQPSFIHETAGLGEDPYIGAFAYIGKGARIGKNVSIYPQCYLGEGVEVGDGTVLYAGVKIYAGCKVGAQCIIHAGCVIGADGFGFAPKDGEYHKIPQIGNVVIEDRVELGANTCIDRATMGSTIIRKGVKLDNLIQVAHNVEIGEHTVMASQTGVAGSTKIGDHCVFGGQVGVVGHLRIGAQTQVGAQSGVSRNLPEKSMVQGSPGMKYADYYRSYAVFKQLPELRRQVLELEDEVKKLKSE